VKFYFDTGKADLPADAKAKIDAIVPKVKAGGKLVVSGFHDSTGNLEQNQELAKQRAFAIRDAIKAAAGIGDERFDMKKPEVTTGGPDNAEARRVEVGVM
jgi:outer membrane protein OmpA-like peptidoglycan-associated protein